MSRWSVGRSGQRVAAKSSEMSGTADESTGMQGGTPSRSICGPSGCHHLTRLRFCVAGLAGAMGRQLTWPSKCCGAKGGQYTCCELCAGILCELCLEPKRSNKSPCVCVRDEPTACCELGHVAGCMRCGGARCSVCKLSCMPCGALESPCDCTGGARRPASDTLLEVQTMLSMSMTV